MFLLLVFLVVAFATFQFIRADDPQRVAKSIFAGLLSVLLLCMLQRQESFHFEVTPWKKSCLLDNPCPQCCSHGFYGQRLNPDVGRTSDVVLQNDSVTCAMKRDPANLFKNRVNDYEALGQTGLEGMCVSGCRSGCDYKLEGYCTSGCDNVQLKATGTDLSGSNYNGTETYCSSGCGGAPTKEAFCSSCSAT